MNILEALIQLRDDIKVWCINNFNNKLNKNLGTENNGKVLSVDEKGDIVTTVKVGQNTTGTEYTIDETTVTAGAGAEIFNDYTKNTASGTYSHAEGRNTKATGGFSHAEGFSTTASGIQSHAEGRATTASGTISHAEGDHTDASGDYSHAEGFLSNATNYASHAEGDHTTASGDRSHAEGFSTTASGTASHAEGEHTTASGAYSHAEGCRIIAAGEYQHAQGKYNIEDTANKYAHIVGNGSDTVRSNAHTLDWDGNAWYQGSVDSTEYKLNSNPLITYSTTDLQDGVSALPTGTIYLVYE